MGATNRVVYRLQSTTFDQYIAISQKRSTSRPIIDSSNAYNQAVPLALYKLDYYYYYYYHHHYLPLSSAAEWTSPIRNYYRYLACRAQFCLNSTYFLNRSLTNVKLTSLSYVHASK